MNLPPLLLADNLGSVLQYPNVSIADQSGTQGPTGFEAWRPFCARRSALVYWQPGTTNAEAYITIAHSQVRFANCLILDRGHNLAGFPVNIRNSQDGFATTTTVESVTIPTAPGSQPADANGALTEEGVWIITFPAQGAKGWRFDIPAMGTGLQPNIVGLYLGMAYSPAGGLYRPYMEHTSQLAAQEVLTPALWRGRGQRGLARAGTLELRMSDPFEYELARYTLDELFGAGFPMWVCMDQSRAHSAFCATRPTGQGGFVSGGTNWLWPSASVAVVEHEPRIL